MKSIELVSPSNKYKESYLRMVEEWQATDEKMIPFVFNLDPTNFDAFLLEIKGYETGRKIPATFVEHSTFWLVKNSDVLGASIFVID
jgi:predicted acetyltransferase